MSSGFNLNVDDDGGAPVIRDNFQIDFEDLEILHDDEIGSGNFSLVCKGIYCGTEVAIKKMKIPKDNPELLKYLKREVLLLNALRHPYVVQFLGWCTPEDSEYLLLVEEFVKGGNLSTLLKRNDVLLSWDTRISICLDIARAMLYLHKRKVLYRDLKSENVLIDDAICPRIAKLCDFGLARSIADFDRRTGPPMTICGTDEWMAPEVMLGMDYNEKSDVFSYGILVLECILGPDAVKQELERTPANCFELDAEQVRNLAKQTACPKDLMELAIVCCAYDPHARPDFNEVLLMLMGIAADAETIHYESYEEIKIDDMMAEELTRSLSKTQSILHAELMRDLSMASTSYPGNYSSGLSSSGSSSNQASPELRSTSNISIAKTKQTPLNSESKSSVSSVNVNTINSIDGVSVVNSKGGTMGSLGQASMRKLLDAPSIFSLDAKAEYVRVESLVDSYTHWNVRIGADASVKDVCDKIGKKLDEKYKTVQLYIVQGKKKVMLGSDQTIGQVKISFGSEKSFKFGVNYLTDTEANSPATLSRGAKKDTSQSVPINRKSSIFNKKTKKSLPETPLIKSI